MLTRTVLPALAAGGVLGLWSASAGVAGPAPGGGFTSTQCGQGYSPGCAVSAGSPGSSAAPGPGIPGGPVPGCGGSASPAFGCVPPGCTVTTATLACPLSGPRGRAPAPGALARLAVRYLRLPDPVIGSSPAPDARQLTQLPTWLWITPAAWRPQSQTAAVAGESATVTATPVSAAWQTGDGATVICRGPGTPYAGGTDPAAASPTCGHTYTRSSAGQPAAAFRVTVTVTWDISWRGTGGAGGTLPPLFTAATARFRVAESQAVNPGGGA